MIHTKEKKIGKYETLIRNKDFNNNNQFEDNNSNLFNNIDIKELFNTTISKKKINIKNEHNYAISKNNIESININNNTNNCKVINCIFEK